MGLWDSVRYLVGWAWFNVYVWFWLLIYGLFDVHLGNIFTGVFFLILAMIFSAYGANQK